MDQSSRGYHSLFWPILLVGLGVVLLLGNLGLIPQVNYWSLTQLWPLLLIVIGLDIIFGRRSTLGSALIGLLTVGAIIAFLIYAPSLGLSKTTGKKTYHFQEPVGSTESVNVTLDMTSYQARVYALDDSNDLINASIDSYGKVDFNVTGDQSKSITLRQITLGFNMLSPYSWGDNMRWDIGLNPKVPINLYVDAASGSTTLDLEHLNLTGLKFDAASGSSAITLPETREKYKASLEGASGSMKVEVPCAPVEIRLDGASGSMNLDIPDKCPLRVDVRDTGSGSIRLPDDLTQTRRGDDDDNEEGVWESENAGSDPTIQVTIINAGSGSIRIH
jgi:hypothetical protein